MKRILTLLAFTLAFHGIATAQVERYIDVSLNLKTPVDSQAFAVGDTIFLDAVLKNMGPDTIIASDSIAIIVFDASSNMALLLNAGSNPYAHIYTNNTLFPGDSIIIKKPLFIADKGIIPYCIDARPYTDSFSNILGTHNKIADTVFANQTKCLKYKGVSGTGIGTYPANTMQVTVYPNPAHGFANLDINLESASDITVNMADATGRVVLQAGKTKLAAGKHSIQLNTSSLASGIYVYQIIADREMLTGKLHVE